MTEPIEDAHHHHHEGYKTAVLKWLPQAQPEMTGDGLSWNILAGNGYGFPDAPTEESAWEAAYRVMQSENAYYLSGPPECLEGTPLGNWLDAAGNIENGPVPPAPNPVE